MYIRWPKSLLFCTVVCCLHPPAGCLGRSESQKNLFCLDFPKKAEHKGRGRRDDGLCSFVESPLGYSQNQKWQAKELYCVKRIPPAGRETGDRFSSVELGTLASGRFFFVWHHWWVLLLSRRTTYHYFHLWQCVSQRPLFLHQCTQCLINSCTQCRSMAIIKRAREERSEDWSAECVRNQPPINNSSATIAAL